MKIVEKKLERSLKVGDVLKYTVNGDWEYRMVTESPFEIYSVVNLLNGKRHLHIWTNLEDLLAYFELENKVEIITDKVELTIK